MRRYHLAKLIQWSEDRLETRKRLQKVVYLLQAAGCPFDAEYILHHYGPYSHDVAEAADQMVQAGLLKENRSKNLAGGLTFSYQLSHSARQQLEKMEQHNGDLLDHEGLAKRLLTEPDLQKLEYGATVAYFHTKGKSWDDARRAAAKFKNQPEDSPAMQDAERLAREVLEPNSRT